LQAQGLEDGSLNAAEMERWTDEIQAEFAAALRFAKESAFPHADAMLRSVYADNKTASARRLPHAA
jgi:TPP-dependent pyruvate/acetoin dehydrogenase alpha subunit